MIFKVWKAKSRNNWGMTFQRFLVCEQIITGRRGNAIIAVKSVGITIPSNIIKQL